MEDSPRLTGLGGARSISVFWDYENCWRGDYLSPSQCYKMLTHAMDRLVGTRRIQKHIYLYASADNLPINDREEYTNNGVEVRDVVSRRKQESVDKRIIADIALLVADLAETGQSSIICLISGDADYGYVLSRVKHRRQVESVLLLTKFEKVKPALINTADRICRMFHACGCEVDPQNYEYQYHHPAGYLDRLLLPPPTKPDFMGIQREVSPMAHAVRSVGGSGHKVHSVGSASSHSLRRSEVSRTDSSVERRGHRVKSRSTSALKMVASAQDGYSGVILTPQLLPKNVTKAEDLELALSGDRELHFVGKNLKSLANHAGTKTATSLLFGSDSAPDAGLASNTDIDSYIAADGSIGGSRQGLLTDDSAGDVEASPLKPTQIDFRSPVPTVKKTVVRMEPVKTKKAQPESHLGNGSGNKKRRSGVGSKPVLISKSSSSSKKKSSLVSSSKKGVIKHTYVQKQRESSDGHSTESESKGDEISVEPVPPKQPMKEPKQKEPQPVVVAAVDAAPPLFSAAMSFEDIMPDLSEYFPSVKQPEAAVSEAKQPHPEPEVEEVTVIGREERLNQQQQSSEGETSEFKEGGNTSSSATTVPDSLPGDPPSKGSSSLAGKMEVGSSESRKSGSKKSSKSRVGKPVKMAESTEFITWQRKAVLNAVNGLVSTTKSEFSHDQLLSALFRTVGDCGSMTTMTSWCEEAIKTSIKYGDIEERWSGRLSKPLLLTRMKNCLEAHPGFQRLDMVMRWINHADPTLQNITEPRYLFNVCYKCSRYFSIRREDRALAKECIRNPGCGKQKNIYIARRS